MDLETENRIASMLLKEAAELRRQADQEGVLAYLKKPSVRARPNSRFLSSTVRGVEQANRAVEVNDMWRLRQKEKELDNRVKCRARDCTKHSSRCSADPDSNTSCSRRCFGNRHHDVPSSSTINRGGDYYKPDDEGLKDEEVEEFLRSRAKRGRGSIGSRMDEMGPYISQSLGPNDDPLAALDHGREERWSRMALGPDRPSWKSKAPSDDHDESEDDHEKRRKVKESSSGSSNKHHSKKHKTKEKTRDKKRKKSRHEKRYS